MARWAYILTAVAGLAGAAGVIEAAAAAHRVSDPRLATSAHFLILNSAATMAIAGFALGSWRGRSWFLAAATVLLGGGLLFCADLSFRALVGARLFPFAAPIGGTLMIIGWLLTAATGLACGLSSPQKR